MTISGREPLIVQRQHRPISTEPPRGAATLWHHVDHVVSGHIDDRRYRTRCPPGVCHIDPAPGTSKLETDIFHQLNYVLGDGKQHFVIVGRQVDMLFLFGSDGLVIEYDGAF